MVIGKPLELPPAVARDYDPTERSTAPHDGRGDRLCGAAGRVTRTSGAAAQRAYRAPCDAEATDFSKK